MSSRRLRDTGAIAFAIAGNSTTKWRLQCDPVAGDEDAARVYDIEEDLGNSTQVDATPPTVVNRGSTLPWPRSSSTAQTSTRLRAWRRVHVSVQRDEACSTMARPWAPARSSPGRRPRQR